MVEASVREGHVNVGDSRLAIFEKGAGYPLVIFHGWPGDDHHMFANYLDPLSRAYRLIFVDLRGHGASDRVPNEALTLNRMANDIAELTEGLELTDFAVLGHSFGAFVALEHAIGGSAADCIILSCGTPSDRFVWAGYDDFGPDELKQQLTEAARQEAAVRDVQHFARLYRAQLPFFFADPFDDRIDEYWARRSKATFSVDAARFFATDAVLDLEFERRLHKVEQPTLILAGRFDRATPVAGAEILAAKIRDSELVILEESGHFPFVEEQDLYLQAIDEFLRSSGSPRSDPPLRLNSL